MAGNMAEVITLEELSLNCITKYFDRIMLQYESKKVSNSSDNPLPINAAVKLLEIFSKQKAYEKHMECLLKASAEELDLQFCEWDIDKVMEQLLTFPNIIKKLSLSGFINQDHLLLLCSQMVKLKSLSLHFTTLMKIVFQTIGKFCTSLETLQLSTCYGVTDKNLQALCPVTESGGSSVKNRHKNMVLKSIDISQTDVTSVGIAYILEHFPNMETITHVDVFTALYSMHGKAFESGIFHNLKQYNLKKLVLYEKDLCHKNALKICSILCPHVCEISLEYVKFPSLLNTLSEFPALTKVHIADPSCISLPPFDLMPILEVAGPLFEVAGKNLITLSLVGCIVPTPTLCRYCPKLTTLKLEYTHFTSMEKFKNMPLTYHFQHLKVLLVKTVDFSLNSVSESIRSILSSAPNLEQWSIHSAIGISLTFVDSLTTYAQKLQELNIINTVIESPAAMKFLLIFPNIKKYNLQGTSIQFQDYTAMKTLKPFVEIDTDYFVSGEERERDTHTTGENSQINVHRRNILDFLELHAKFEYGDISGSESDDISSESDDISYPESGDISGSESDEND